MEFFFKTLPKVVSKVCQNCMIIINLRVLFKGYTVAMVTSFDSFSFCRRSNGQCTYVFLAETKAEMF